MAKNFKGKILTGSSLKKADIRGVDFTNAILKEVDFEDAKTGLTRYSAVCSVSISCVVASLLAIILEFASQRTGDRLVYTPNPDTSPDYFGINIWIVVIILSIFVTFIFTIHKGLEATFKTTVNVGRVLNQPRSEEYDDFDSGFGSRRRTRIDRRRPNLLGAVLEGGMTPLLQQIQRRNERAIAEIQARPNLWYVSANKKVTVFVNHSFDF